MMMKEGLVWLVSDQLTIAKRATPLLSSNIHSHVVEKPSNMDQMKHFPCEHYVKFPITTYKQ